MKLFSEEALSALAAGEAVVSGAVRIGTAPNLIRFWGGYGVMVIDGEAYLGVGDRGLVAASEGALGGADVGAEVTLSRVDPDVMAQVDLKALRGQPVVLYRLVFNSTGARLLHAAVYLRGRIDRAQVTEKVGDASVITLGVEGAARGLGRRSERMRTDADQRLIKPDDGGFRHIAYAGDKAIYFGGQKPQRAGSALGGVSAGAAAFINVATRGAIKL